ncbi:5-carboxymethyl-2-hydroxymuconate isomerase [Rhodococcus sp. BP-241]|uniref:5-carboxymethyl-2-hydroxymuconate Delta-isomerase n=1 Tax=Rhodococcus sp. BP-241 TaxID=2739441 RepID=UPI001C9A77FB|nr:5-carboxymethyl-2-hydroxymuconate Delta-isomerase [Rhodococcus sp. BP-241]MBY6708656.1 5-carboxymethyl-2-hydroxymuconate isomerase [Rhodococcus sp. BP-241]
MPHISIEYTRNLADRVDVTALVDALHSTAQRLNVFPDWGIRTFATVVDTFRVADDVAGGDTGYVHVRVKVAGGRDEMVLQRIVDEFHATLAAALADLCGDRSVGYQLELFEFRPATTRSGGSIPGAPALSM